MKKAIILCFLFIYALPVLGQDGFLFDKKVGRVSIPFKFINNLIFIPIKVNGIELNFLLDSGVEETILFSMEDKKDVSFFNTEKIILRGLGSEESIEGLKSTNNILEIKGLKSTNQLLYIVLDQSFNFSTHIGIPVNGIIGFPFFENNLVGLHNFIGGYCGVSKVENNRINICYLVDFETFKQYKNIEEFQSIIVCKNPHMKSILENSKLLFEKPLTISQISFEKKGTVENHILMIGDTAGLIHPLCGNGMAMAIHSAKIVSELVIEYLHNKIYSRKELEEKYSKEWNTNFKSRLRIGRILSKILRMEKLAPLLIQLLAIFPFLLPKIIKRTHGKPIILKN